ncbi:hypothetical protein J1907_17870 [Lysinibacillus sphaericus]|uniref:hypothetical protein n=1 Tax=Lysinibacillus sphaericus TaxID=1421 RepID=UPI00055CECC5|nr:hypothetical protein [Lysinibacillus sphaericus]QTB21594.1 hypothetical protein J1907_17870 [Lysinibacillus sphaericus]
MALDYNEVFQFMKEFKVDLLNRFGELIIDEPTNTYVTIKDCKDIEDVKTYVVFALCRPISKGLGEQASSRLLKRLNDYFNVNLTKQDCLLMYRDLCYVSKLEQFKDFIKRGFPLDELKSA